MRIVDLSPTVPEGFRGPPSTDAGVHFDVRTKPGYWQSSLAELSVHTGCHVECELHVQEGGRAIDALPLERVIGSAVVLDLTPPIELAEIGPDELTDAAERLLDGCGGHRSPARAPSPSRGRLLPGDLP